MNCISFSIGAKMVAHEKIIKLFLNSSPTDIFLRLSSRTDKLYNLLEVAHLL